jgi:polysaccharide export outer membrane protein
MIHKPNTLFTKNVIFFSLLIVILFLESCATKKDILYIQTPDNNTFENKILDQKIELNDILSVKIGSLNTESSSVYNIDMMGSNATTTGTVDANIALKNYLVNNEGLITLPVLGNIKVNDKTTSELEKFLTKKLIDEGHLIEPTVGVRILNSKVTILGEVRNPGTYSFPEKNITLLQALGLAGDLTINGVRNDVLLIRQDVNGKTINHINLTKKDWMNTDLYYIKQNDVIVVNPNNAKIKSAGIIGNAGSLISVISILLTIFVLLKK